MIPMFMAPSVTPWLSDLPDVGSNNPGLRLYHYSRQSRRIVDYTQYFLNLTAANNASHDNWTVEYRATQAYGISVIDAASLHEVVQQFVNGSQLPDLFGRYFRYNSVSYNLSICTGQCKKRQVCAAAEVEFNKYTQCLQSLHCQSSTVSTTTKSHHHRHGMQSSTVSTTTKSHHRRHRMQMFTYILLGGLILLIAVLFLLLAVCCCQRRHAIVYFSRSHYSLIHDDA